MKKELTTALITKCEELLLNHERNIKVYEVAFQEVIESVTGKIWWEVTDCNIFMHLLEHNNPHDTVVDIILNLKEDFLDD